MTGHELLRKQPSQERSRLMCERILSASLRVLQREGALGFTTTRVADEANVSVGSLYQYFPDKHALVLALHDRDIQEGWRVIESVLNDENQAPRERLHSIVLWFFTTEAHEVAELNDVGGDIDVFLRRGVADTAVETLVIKHVAAFIRRESRDTWTVASSRFAARYVATTVESVGKALAAQRPTAAELRKWAVTTSTMLNGYLQL